MRECSHKVPLRTRAIKVGKEIGSTPENFQMLGNADFVDIVAIFNLMTIHLEFASRVL